jgi:AcrR family transcriptional regulator
MHLHDLETVPSSWYSLTMGKPNKRDELLEHASQIVLREGAAALTLDALALEAGISKGGVLYHFPSKERLLTAMVEALIAGFERGLEAARDDEAGGFSRAYLRATAMPNAEESSLTAGLLASVAQAPETVAPLQERYRHWNTRLHDDGIDEVDAQIVRLAADGLWLADLLGLAPPNKRLRKRIVARLEEVTRTKRSAS